MTPELVFEILKSLVSIVPDVWQIYEDAKNKKPVTPDVEALLKDLELALSKFQLNK